MATTVTSPKKAQNRAPRSPAIRLTIRDLELFPEPLDDTRYELIGGKLHVTKQPHVAHQRICLVLGARLETWSAAGGGGSVVPAPGVIFTPEDAVAPDLVWVSAERAPQVIGEDGKLHAAPDLVIEVLSPGQRNRQRDLELKLELYARYGVAEYWVVDWKQRSVAVHRREGDRLRRTSVLDQASTLESPLLPGFALPLADLFARLT